MSDKLKYTVSSRHKKIETSSQNFKLTEQMTFHTRMINSVLVLKSE